ncbi:MAG: M13 family metallopeptidase [Acidobacteriota bacterium]|nr:M13 family metallopeptidase [Acidobacteriota bacterium]
MRRFRNSLAASLLVCLLCACVVLAQSQHGLDLAAIDKSADACVDFYQYANGGWLAKNPIPAAFSAWGTDSLLSEKNRDVMHEVLEAAAKNTSAAKGSNEQKVGDFYASCMAEDQINAAGLKPLQAELARIAAIKDAKGVQAEIARLHEQGFGALFRHGSGQDAKNSAEVIFDVRQGGLGLPDRDYYLKDDDRSKPIRAEYLKHVARMFELMGDEPARASAEAQAVMDMETKLAAASMTRVERRDPQKTYHRMTAAELQKLTPNFDWAEYFKTVGLPRDTVTNVGQPKFFEEANRQLTSASVADWQTYLRWHLINPIADTLSKPFDDEDFNFKGRILTGATEQLPRWKRCVAATDRSLGEALGEVYVKKAFPPEAKRRALEMVQNLIAALRSDIGTLSWMSDPTRRQAVAKLETLVKKIGYPDKWRDYSALKIGHASYVENSLRASEFEARRDRSKIGRPVDKLEWGMTPPTVNAYYNPQINEIVFPAGILQWPFFDPSADDAFNYGAMGAVIGHEMTHGFDDQGAQFDAAGNLKNWWTEADLKNFKERTNCVVTQFNQFEIEKGLNENGALVVGESVADLGGLVIAYAAWQKSMEGKPKPPVIDGFTPEQRFFLAYAYSWATNVRPERARLLAQTDPHPLPKFRVNGPLANFPAFAAAFGCKSGDPMVREEKDRCVIW